MCSGEPIVLPSGHTVRKTLRLSLRMPPGMSAVLRSSPLLIERHHQLVDTVYYSGPTLHHPQISITNLDIVSVTLGPGLPIAELCFFHAYPAVRWRLPPTTLDWAGR